MTHKTTHQFAQDLLALPNIPVLVMRSDGDCFAPVLLLADTELAGRVVFIDYDHDAAFEDPGDQKTVCSPAWIASMPPQEAAPCHPIP